MRSSNTFGFIHTPVHDYMKIPEGRAAVDKEFEKLEKIPALDTNKVKEREDVKREAERNGITVHFANLMALCFIKNAELEKALQKYKGRLVLRGATSRIKMEFKLCSLNKEPVPQTWWQENPWMLLPECQEWQVQQPMQSHHTLRSS